WLDVVGLATVADMVPLTGENRVIVAKSFAKFAANPHPGLAALATAAGYKAKPDEYMYAFVFGPRINASGRLGSAEPALGLLRSKTREEAVHFAQQLNSDNAARRDAERQLVAAAVEEAEKTHARGDKLTFVHAPGWNVGLAGLAAARLVSRYHRPAIVLCEDGEGGASGSARSVPGIHINECLMAGSKYLTRYGGHAMAGGMALRVEDIPAFKTAITEYLNAFDSKYFRPGYEVDGIIDATDCTLELCDALNKLAPFGQGNPAPVLAIRGSRLQNVRGLGEGAHVGMQLHDGNKGVSAVAFRKGGSINLLKKPVYFDVAFRLERHEWRGEVSPQAVVSGWRVSPTTENLCNMIDAESARIEDNYFRWASAGNRVNIKDMGVFQDDGQPCVYLAFTPQGCKALLQRFDREGLLEESVDIGLCEPPDSLALPALWLAPDARDLARMGDCRYVLCEPPPAGMLPPQARVWRLCDMSETEEQWLATPFNRELCGKVWHAAQKLGQDCTRDKLTAACRDMSHGAVQAAVAVFIELQLMEPVGEQLQITDNRAALTESPLFCALYEATHEFCQESAS
ncbi:MAG: DHH family phosphoesterase, partial [Clostridia bacterium]|nr:DHH family phosphoesterase [Clostridia bacterium]